MRVNLITDLYFVAIVYPGSISKQITDYNPPFTSCKSSIMCGNLLPAKIRRSLIEKGHLFTGALLAMIRLTISCSQDFVQSVEPSLLRYLVSAAINGVLQWA